MEMSPISPNLRQRSRRLMVHPPTNRYRIPKIIQTADAIIPKTRTTNRREEAGLHSSSVILGAVLSPFRNRLERRLGGPILGRGAVKMNLHIQGKDIIEELLVAPCFQRDTA